MEDTSPGQGSLSHSASASVAFRAGDIGINSSAQSFQGEDDSDWRIRLKRMTSNQTFFERPMTARSVRKRSLGQRMSCISTPPAQYNPRQHISMPSPLQAPSRLSHASNASVPNLDPENEFIGGQDPQDVGKAFGGRKRNLLKTAMRSLLGQKSQTERPLDPPIEANLPRHRDAPADVGISSMAMGPSGILRRSASSPTLRHGRPASESYAHVGSRGFVFQRKRVKPAPSNPQLRSTTLESVYEAPNESTARQASNGRRSTSLNDRQPVLSGQTRQIRPPVNRDKLKRVPMSLDPLFQIRKADSGSLRQRGSADRNFGERSHTETDIGPPLEAPEGLALEELAQDRRGTRDRPAHHPMPSEHKTSLSPALAEDDATDLEERVDNWQVGLQSLGRMFSASGQSLETAEDSSWTATHDHYSSYASGTLEPNCLGRNASDHYPARPLSASQHESRPTGDQFLVLLNLINHERAARKALQSRLQELKIEIAELRSKSPTTHPLRMHPVLPQAPPSPPPSAPDIRLSASFSGLIKHRLEKATGFAPPRPPSPISLRTAQRCRESDQTEKSDHVNTEVERA